MFRVKPALKEYKMFQTKSYIFNIFSAVPLPSSVSKYFGIKSMKLSVRFTLECYFLVLQREKPIKSK